MLSISSPLNNQPFQRGKDNLAVLKVTGLSDSNVSIQAIPLNGGKAVSASANISNAQAFQAILSLEAGYYRINCNNATESSNVICCVGEIFIVIGHSFTEAYGADNCNDERVICPNSFFTPMQDENVYKESGFIVLKDLSLASMKNTENDGQVLNSKQNGIWGRMGDSLVAKYNCPVAIFNAGFGGSELRQWALAAEKKQFQHSFVNSSVRMPFIKFINILKYVVNRTGCRGVLCVHGDNDKEHPDSELIASYYQTVIDTARRESGYSDLHFTLALSVTNYADFSGIVEGAKKAIERNKNVQVGPSIYLYGNELRKEDKLHLNQQGEAKAAYDFAEILGTSAYLFNANPVLVKQEDKDNSEKALSRISTFQEKLAKVNMKWVLSILAILMALLLFIALFKNRKTLLLPK